MTIDPATPERQVVTAFLILLSFLILVAARTGEGRYSDGFLLMAMTLALIAAISAAPISFVFPSL